MPLTHLGQLEPTMKQIVALQKALLALQVKPETSLGRAMSGGSPGSYAGPAPASAEEKEPIDWEHIEDRQRAARERALATQLRAAQPSTGGAPDWQAEAWAKRTEMLEARKEEAKGLYDRLLPLDEEGRKITLDAARRYKPEVVTEMERAGYISGEGRLAELAKDKKVANISYVTEEDGEMVAVTAYEDGTRDTEHTGVYPGPTEAALKAAVGAEPTISEGIALGKFGMEQQEFVERYREQAMKAMGDMPRPGIDTLTINGKEVLATAEHANAWLEGVNALTAYLSGGAEGALAGEALIEGTPITMPEIKAQYAGRPDLISTVQENLGIPVTGVWDDETDRQFNLYGPTVEGEPTIEGEAKPTLDRKERWPDWVKKWGKAFKGVEEAVKVGVKYVK